MGRTAYLKIANLFINEGCRMRSHRVNSAHSERDDATLTSDLRPRLRRWQREIRRQADQLVRPSGLRSPPASARNSQANRGVDRQWRQQAERHGHRLSTLVADRHHLPAIFERHVGLLHSDKEVDTDAGID